MENQIVIYQTDNGQTAIDVRLENEMLWLTRHQIAVLFDRDYKTISKHINNALQEELADSVVVAKFATTTQHGAMEGKTQTHDVEYFNLEVITSVGYRVGQIYQTFGGNDLYPSVEEKAAMLLYLVTKNHSFSDGNKRIAATLFLWFLNNNGILYREDGSKRIADNTLVALTLMIAESKPEEKDVMVKVVVNLINQKN